MADFVPGARPKDIQIQIYFPAQIIRIKEENKQTILQRNQRDKLGVLARIQRHAEKLL